MLSEIKQGWGHVRSPNGEGYAPSASLDIRTLNDTMITNCKAIISGNTVEIYKYFDTPLEYGYTRFRAKRVGDWNEFDGREYAAFDYGEKGLIEFQKREKMELSDDEKDDNLRRSIQRASSSMRRLASANHHQYLEFNKPFQTKHLTLTIQDSTASYLEKTNPYFTSFIRRMNRYLFNRNERLLRYIAVPEWQERGVVHYHTLLFNMPYVPQNVLQDIWEMGLPDTGSSVKGIVFIAVRDNPKVIMYLTKYLVKNYHEPLLQGKRKYFPSVNLLRPRVEFGASVASEIHSNLPLKFLTYQKDYQSVRNGKVGYYSYLLPDTSGDFYEKLGN